MGNVYLFLPLTPSSIRLSLPFRFFSRMLFNLNSVSFSTLSNISILTFLSLSLSLSLILFFLFFFCFCLCLSHTHMHRHTHNPYHSLQTHSNYFPLLISTRLYFILSRIFKLSLSLSLSLSLYQLNRLYPSSLSLSLSLYIYIYSYPFFSFTQSSRAVEHTNCISVAR